MQNHVLLPWMERSCLLYGSPPRRKEVAVRRVLGASVGTILSLLAEDFAYRIAIQWWVFVVTGLLTALIALLTVSVQRIKAALLNPVKSLRSE